MREILLLISGVCIVNYAWYIFTIQVKKNQYYWYQYKLRMNEQRLKYFQPSDYMLHSIIHPIFTKYTSRCAIDVAGYKQNHHSPLSNGRSPIQLLFEFRYSQNTRHNIPKRWKSFMHNFPLKLYILFWAISFHTIYTFLMFLHLWYQGILTCETIYEEI